MKSRSAKLPLVLAALFFLLPPSLALLYPISFWLGNDYEPLGLANALNLAFRLGHHHMYPANGLTNHPGLPFYFLTWSALALSGYPFASTPLEFFHAVLEHIRTYQLLAMALAALVGACSVYLFVRITASLVSAPVIVLSILLWMLSTPGTVTTFLSPSNESFAFAVNSLFLFSLFQITRDDRGMLKTFVLAAAVSSIAYLNKLSYIYVPAALCAAMIAQYGFSRSNSVRLLGGLIVFSAMFVAILIAIGYFIIGWNDFRALLNFHRAVALGSGLYGAGSQTVVSSDEVLSAFRAIPSDKTFALPIALIGGAGLSLTAGLLLLRSRQPRPELTIAIGCGVASALSALFVFKHYAFHYSAGVSATLPGCVIAFHLLMKGRLSRIATLIAASVTVLVAYPVALRLQSYLRNHAELTKAAVLDRDEICNLTGSRVIEFAYRVPFPEYGEGFVLTYAGIQPLTAAYLGDRRGTTNSFAEALVHEDVGAYVIDKNYFPTADAVKAASNVDLLGPKPVQYQDGDTLLELRTVFLLLRPVIQ